MPGHGLGGDIVVALGSASVGGKTLWGQNSHRPPNECQTLVRVTGKPHAFDEKVRTQYRELPQARQTYTVLGSQPEGYWGFSHGVNDQQLVVGTLPLQNKLKLDQPGLLGLDLVRLTLERSRNVSQAVEVLAALIQEYGQGSFADCPAEVDHDNAFLLADRQEAMVLEASGRYWAVQEVSQVRALSGHTSIRQDWDRICPGLSHEAIQRGWWPQDGSKLNFAHALAEDPRGSPLALRHWGRRTLLLEQQNGDIDHLCLRRILSDPHDAETELPAPLSDETSAHGPTEPWPTAASMIVQLGSGADEPPLVWCAFGPPGLTAYLPVLLDGELPEAMTRTDRTGLWHQVQELVHLAANDALLVRRVQGRFNELETQFDQEAEAFAQEAAAWKRAGDVARLSRLAGLFMQHVVERFQDALGATVRMGRSAHLVTI